VKLQWTNEARADRDAIYSFIEGDHPRAAIKLDETFA
jgi:plasmid stabilization system protein ParE